MRGIGGPLLTIGDLLSDVGEPDDDSLIHNRPNQYTHTHDRDRSPKSPAAASPDYHQSPADLECDPSQLSIIFQENYDQLKKALGGTDHSWTSLTLKLCTALDTAKKLIESSNSNVLVLSEKVGELEEIMKKGDASIPEVRSIHSALSQRIASLSDTQDSTK